MLKEEIFEDRRAVARKICEKIRSDNGKLINAKYFLERPYSDGAKSYKFSSANYLRLLSSDNEAICKCDPRWVSTDEIQANNWTLKENVQSESLEVWTKSSDGEPEGFLQEFYNAADIVEKETFQHENQSLEAVLEFLTVRSVLEKNGNIISLQKGLKAIKKYAEAHGADDLISILTCQTWLSESGLKTRMKSFLPVFNDDILAELEKNPDRLFESMNLAQAVLKNLRREKIKSSAEKITTDELFSDLKIIYHGSEKELRQQNGTAYPKESILTGCTAYEFLRTLVSADEQKIWLEFSYKGYTHGKILLSGEDFRFNENESITMFLKERLDKNRRQLLNNSQNLNSEILEQIELETKHFLTVMNNFEQEEISCLESLINS